MFTSFWIEKHLWDLAPAGYHAVNVGLHALGALLVWRLALALRVRGAWLLAALFALHPVHVESVAWISERKNVLSGVFYLLAALAYLRFEPPERAAGGTNHRRVWYAAACALFVLALLAKTVTCSLPAALILFLLWRDGHVTRRQALVLVPLFAVGLAFALHTAWLERTHVGAEAAPFDFTLAERVLIASKALLFYPAKLLVPWPLVFQYPRWTLDASSAASYWPVLVVALAGTLALVAYRRGRRAPALALAFFAGTLFPALGFVDVYPMRYTFVADHFQYLASLGVLALVAGALVRSVPRRVLAPACGIALVALGVLTWRQCLVYADQETLWRATLRYNPDAWMAHTNLADVLSERGEDEAALAELAEALALDPPPEAVDQIRLDLGIACSKLGRFQEALGHYRALQATRGGAEVRIAQTLERLGRDDEAEAAFRLAIASASARDAWLPLGLHLLRRGRPAEACKWLARFVEANPDSVDGLMFLADARAASGDFHGAIDAAERALAAARTLGDVRTAGLIAQRLAELREAVRGA